MSHLEEAQYEEELEKEKEARKERGEIDLLDKITQGSFLPVTLMALAGQFPTNDYIIDEKQGAKLVHYIGTFGNVKALKTFMEKFDIDLAAVDTHGQTIVHYAARKGQLKMLKYLREMGRPYGVTLEMENSYGLTPIVYTMMNQQVHSFIYLYFKIGCQLSEERACWTVTQMIKSGSNDTQILQLLFHDENLSDSVSRTALKASIEHSNAHFLQACLKHLFFC